MLSLRVEHADGTTNTLTAASARLERALDEQDRAEVTVYRDEWNPVVDAITPRKAKLYVVNDKTDEFGGRLDDTDTQNDTVRVRLNSPEIDAVEAEPTGTNALYENASDKTIVQDQLNAVSTLSAGTVTEQASALSYSASFASRSKVLYDLREATGSEFAYNADWTVDYVDRLGSDKSGTMTVGPSNRNVGDQFRKREDVRENVTHVQGLGAQSGPEQITASAVSSSYSSGRKIWKRYENKEVYQQGRLQAIVDELVAEYDGEPRSLTVTCRVYPDRLADSVVLGDTVTVDYAEEDIDRALRVRALERRYSEQAGHVLDVTLSNRSLSRERRQTKRNDDLQRFNRGHQGFVDRDQVASGWNGAGDGVAQTLEVPSWPDDIVREDTVELTVQGRAWRSPIDATGHSHSVDVTHPQHSHDVTHPQHSHSVSTTSDASSAPFTTNFPNNVGGTTTITGGTSSDVATYTVEESTFLVFALLNLRLTSSSGRTLTVSLDNNTTGDTSISDTNPMELNSDESVVVSAVAPGDLNGDTLAWDAYNVSSSDASVDYEAHFLEMGQHDHGVSDTSSAELGTTQTSDTSLGTTSTESSTSVVAFDPGIVNSFNNTQYYPTDVEVAVDGTTITTLPGDGSDSWQTTVDLSGELSAGSNTITALPTGDRGEVNLTLFSELFRRGAKSN